MPIDLKSPNQSKHVESDWLVLPLFALTMSVICGGCAFYPWHHI